MRQGDRGAVLKEMLSQGHDISRKRGFDHLGQLSIDNAHCYGNEVGFPVLCVRNENALLTIAFCQSC